MKVKPDEKLRYDIPLTPKLYAPEPRAAQLK